MPKKLEWKTEKRKVNDLVELEINPRKISEEKKQKLIESLDKFNLAEIPAINVDNKIIGGNQRIIALKTVGRGEELIDVRIPNRPLTEEEFKEYCIISNTHAGEFDWEIFDLHFDGVDLDEIGFNVPDLDTRPVPIDEEAVEDDYEIPDEIETDIVIGDLFEIGTHRLLCGDSTDSDQVARLMAGQKSDIVFTDPPYNVNMATIKHKKFKQRAILNDNMSKKEFKEFCIGFISNIVLFNKGCVYMTGYPSPDGRIMFVECDNVMHCSTVIIWNKDQFTLGRGKYQSKYEPIWFGWVHSGINFYGDRKQVNVWDIPRPKKSIEHPTIKPLALIERALNHASRMYDIVLDLFLGSGSTMVTAHQLKRKCYGMELDPKYCQVIIDRMLKFDPFLTIKRNGEIWNTQKIS